MTNREEGGGEKQTTTKKRKDKQMKERGVEKETIDVEREREVTQVKEKSEIYVNNNRK